MTKAKRKMLVVEQETEAEIVPIAHAMLCRGVSKDVTMDALRGAARELLHQYGEDHGVKSDPKLLVIRAGLVAEKAMTTAALNILRDAA